MQENVAASPDGAPTSTAVTTKSPAKVPMVGNRIEKASKMSSKEKKEKDKEELRPIIVKLVNEIHDFGAGFHKPTIQDLLG